MEIDQRNGINGAADVFWRPTFSVNALREEQTSNEIIARALFTNGSQSGSHLYESLDESYHQNRWRNLSVFIEFIRKRSHMFSYNAVSGKISNRGFGYMRGMIVLVTFVCDKTQEGSCTLEDLFKLVTRLPHYKYNMPWKDKYMFEVPPKNVDELSYLLKRDHADVFHISNGLVSLHTDVRSISSYWSTYGQVRIPVEEEGNKYHYIDRSRKYRFYIYIITRTATYLKGIIESGTFINRSVYILGKNVGLVSSHDHEQSEIPDHYATGTRASVTAAFCLNGACSFTATNIMADGMRPDVFSVTIGEQEFDEFFKQTNAGRESLDDDDDIMFVEDLRSIKIKEITQAMEQECKCQLFSDGLFGDHENLDMKVLIEQYERVHAVSPFRSVADFQNFLSTRRHLFEKFENGEYPLFSKRSHAERLGYNQLFDLLKLQKYESGITLTDLKKIVRSNGSLDSFKMLFTLSIKGKIEEIINSYYFDIVRMPEPREDLLILRGVYSSGMGCFLPGYEHSYNRSF